MLNDHSTLKAFLFGMHPAMCAVCVVRACMHAGVLAPVVYSQQVPHDTTSHDYHSLQLQSWQLACSKMMDTYSMLTPALSCVPTYL